MSSNNENKIRKTLLTPCRRQGLKRKSLESTPNTSHDFTDSGSPCAINTVLNRSSAYSNTINTTPVRQVIEKSDTQVGKEKKPKVEQGKSDTTPVLQVIEKSDTQVGKEKEPKVEQRKSDEVSLSESNENDTFLHHEEDQDNDDLDSQIEKIKKRISEKSLEIEKLELDSKNVKQHNLDDLNLLICKWRRGCQTALKDLSQEYQNRDNNLTLPILLNQLGIPQALVQYSETEMDFKY